MDIRGNKEGRKIIAVKGDRLKETWERRQFMGRRGSTRRRDKAKRECEERVRLGREREEERKEGEVIRTER